MQEIVNKRSGACRRTNHKSQSHKRKNTARTPFRPSLRLPKMSKIDELLATVDTLTAQSDMVASSVAESNMLISLILQVNSSIATVDSQIDSMTGIINKNNVCLNELEKLYEKSYYLETNLHTNDVYISEASLDCLAKEYEYVLSSLSFGGIAMSPVMTPRRVNLQPLVANLQPPVSQQAADLQPQMLLPTDLQPVNSALPRLYLPLNEELYPRTEELQPLSTELQHDRALQSKLSLSNLELKPLRCKHTRVLKQKSRYRLSAAYTLNPVQEVRNVLSSSRDTYESSVMDHLSNHESSMSADEEEEDEEETGVENGPATSTKCKKEGRKDEMDAHASIDPSHTAYLQPEAARLHSKLAPLQTEAGLSQPSTTLKSEKPHMHVDASLLLHDARQASSPRAPSGFGALDIRAFDLALLEEYNVTLLTSPGSITSLDESGGSPPRLDEIDNFHRYLRQSRVDLQAAIQKLPLPRSRSHESIFLDAAHSKELYAPDHLAPPRFHNPTDFIVAASAKGAPVLPPTVETVYLSSFDQLLAMGEHPHLDFKTLSRKLLLPLDPPVTPQKNNFGLFGYLSSPTPGVRDEERRGSTEFGKSLALSLRNLVSIKSDTLPVRRTKQSPPEKIKQMRRGIRDPITGRSESISKRLPPQGLERQLRNGGHSSLTIGPNKTRIVNHGQELIFKKPTVRRMSLSLIREALNDSIFL